MSTFDLIIIQDLRAKQDVSSYLPDLDQWRALTKKIQSLCDCQWPTGESTWKGDFFGSICEICGRNDY